MNVFHAVPRLSPSAVTSFDPQASLAAEHPVRPPAPFSIGVHPDTGAGSPWIYETEIPSTKRSATARAATMAVLIVAAMVMVVVLMFFGI